MGGFSLTVSWYSGWHEITPANANMKMSGLRRLNSKRVPRAGGEGHYLPFIRLTVPICCSQCESSEHLHKLNTITCLYEDSWPEAPNTAESCAFRSGRSLIQTHLHEKIQRFIKFHPSLKGSFKVEPAFPIHLQAWGIILITILIASLPLKVVIPSKAMFDIRLSSLSLLQMGISLKCPLLSHLRLHTAS